MCCFTSVVDNVYNTRIFARMGQRGNQALIYEMALTARQDVAMVLPVPVKAGSGEDAVKFFNFKDYKTVFDDLNAGFPMSRGMGDPFGAAPAAAGGGEPLAVVEVGSYDASFVPAIRDFTRLDERFRLPAGVWDKLPGYRDFGFVVYKLKLDAGKFERHPMAFAFPTARPRDVFFPTLHIHDGQVHEKEDFDHVLYLQAGDYSALNLEKWEASPKPAVGFAKCGLTHGMIRPEMHVFRQIIRGLAPNGDIVVKPRAA